MADKDRIEIDAYDPKGGFVLCQVFSTYDWYEKLHPIIDTDEERVRLNVSVIEGRQYNREGTMFVHWRMKYNPDGSIAESWEWRNDSSSKYQ